MKKALNILVDILIAVVFVVAAVMIVLVVSSSKSDAKVPTLFGYSLMAVQSDSMDVDGGFAKGDLIVVRTLTDEQCNALQIGDVVTYIRYFQNQGFLETHRLVENNSDVNPDFFEIADEVVDGVWIHDGKHYYMTMGDNPNSVKGVDVKENGKVEYACAGNIVGQWDGVRIAGLGQVMDFMKSQLGFMLCVVLPVAIFFIYELYIFISTLTRKQKEKTLQEVADKEEELKAKAVAEFLAQQQTNSEGISSSPSEPIQEESASVGAVSEISEDEKQQIIQEYLKTHKKDSDVE